MPQFDISHYVSQIFWFAICFSILYYFVSSKILPRIRDIIRTRQDVIDNDLAATSITEKKLGTLQGEISVLKGNATSNYQTRIDEAAKSLAKERENSIEKLKNKIDSDIKKSQAEIKDFLAKSREQSGEVIKNLTQEIKIKILK